MQPWTMERKDFPDNPCYFVVQLSLDDRKFPTYWCLVSEVKLVSFDHFEYFLSKVNIDWNRVNTGRFFMEQTYEEAIATAQSLFMNDPRPLRQKKDSRLINVYCPFYPNAKGYLKFYRRAMEHFSQPGEPTVKLAWNEDALDLDGFKKEFLEALHRRINLKGCDRREFREEQIHLWRDQQRLNAWRKNPWHQRKTQWGLGLETRYVRRRYPNVDKQMHDELFDND